MRACNRALLISAYMVIGIVIWIMTSCATVGAPQAKSDVRALHDPTLIERGRYLAEGPAHCYACHGDPARAEERSHGQAVALSGGRAFDLGPLGSIVAPNITSDPAAGIGALSDETLVRSLRYGISRHGEPLAPFMSFAELADDDLRAILSYLRTLEPVPRPAPSHHLSWLGNLMVDFVMRPRGPTRVPPTQVKPERSAEYGRYLAYTVANCHGCHTRRSKLTGAFVGPDFAGGMEIENFVTPNLTPIAAGVVQRSTEQQFIERFRANGQVRSASPMPWDAFARMTDADLGALYRFLKTLPPAEPS